MSIIWCVFVQVVVPLYYAAVRYNTPRLLANSSHFLLQNYQELEDSGHEVLLHLLENSNIKTGSSTVVTL